MKGLWKTWDAAETRRGFRRKREFQEFPPYVRLLSWTRAPYVPNVGRLSPTKVGVFFTLNILPFFIFWQISRYIISYIPVINVNLSLRLLMERSRKALSRLEFDSAFPLASALPSLTFCFLILNLVCDMPECVCVRTWVCVCVCVRILCCQWFECTQSRLGRVKGCGQGGGGGSCEGFRR